MFKFNLLLTLFFNFLLPYIINGYLYPYGPSADDIKIDQNVLIDISRNQFPFLGKYRKYIYLCMNGLVVFNDKIVPPKTYNLRFTPNNETSFVTAFFTNTGLEIGPVFFRQKVNNTIDNDIKKIYKLNNFISKWTLVATWYDIGFEITNHLKNTFQVVLTTDGKDSYVMFNYDKIQWPTGYDINSAFSGYHGGGSNTFFKLSEFPLEFKNLPRNSNVKQLGRFVYHISGQDNIILKKEFYYIGGEHMLIENENFIEKNIVTVIFDGKIENECFSIDEFRRACEVPFLKRIGSIPILIKVNEKYFLYDFIISVDLPNTPGIEFFHPNSNYIIANPKNDIFVSIRKELLPNTVNFDFYYVYIDENTQTTVTQFIKKQDHDQNKYLLNLRHVMQEFKDSEPMKFAFIAVKERNLPKKYKNITNFRKQNLNNYFYYKYISVVEFYLTSDERINEYKNKNKCSEWYKKEPSTESITNLKRRLPPCWRTLNWLSRTFGDFVLDSKCNPLNPNMCKLFHSDAFVCYTSVSNFNSSAQQCCYNNKFELLVGPSGGGSLDFYHSSNPLKHYQNDILPYFWCCIQSNNCHLYYEKRPSDDGDTWISPRLALAGGDPHLITLDGLNYTFNGYGEYTLLEIPSINFQVQIRMTPLKIDNDSVSSGTVFTALAIEGSNMDTIQIDINKNVTIYVNKILFEMNKNLIVLNGVNFYISNNQYTIQLSNGIIFEMIVTQELNAFSIITEVPKNYKFNTRGLLGVMDDNIENDFTLPDDNVLKLNPLNDREIFYKFGEQWRVKLNNSIFKYEDGYDYKYFNNQSYTPRFMFDGIKFNNDELRAKAIKECGQNNDCLFDVSQTGQLSIGNLDIDIDKLNKNLTEIFKNEEINLS